MAVPDHDASPQGHLNPLFQTITQEKKMSENVAGESPIACNLKALDSE
jgi:hypothetical protein